MGFDAQAVGGTFFDPDFRACFFLYLGVGKALKPGRERERLEQNSEEQMY